MEAEPKLNVKANRIQKAIDFIHTNLDEKLTVQELAMHAAMSLKNFQRVFKKETRQTVTEYIRDARMKKARNLLAGSTEQVTKVAWNVGYQDLTHFERDFKRLTGATPSEYRKNNSRS